MTDRIYTDEFIVALVPRTQNGEGYVPLIDVIVQRKGYGQETTRTLALYSEDWTPEMVALVRVAEEAHRAMVGAVSQWAANKKNRMVRKEKK